MRSKEAHRQGKILDTYTTNRAYAQYIVCTLISSNLDFFGLGGWQFVWAAWFDHCLWCRGLCWPLLTCCTAATLIDQGCRWDSGERLQDISRFRHWRPVSLRKRPILTSDVDLKPPTRSIDLDWIFESQCQTPECTVCYSALFQLFDNRGADAQTVASLYIEEEKTGEFDPLVNAKSYLIAPLVLNNRRTPFNHGSTWVSKVFN